MRTNKSARPVGPVLGVGTIAAAIGTALVLSTVRTTSRMRSGTLLQWGSGDYTGDRLSTLDDWHYLPGCMFGPSLRFEARPDGSFAKGYECWADRRCGVFDMQQECDIDLLDVAIWFDRRQ